MIGLVTLRQSKDDRIEELEERLRQIREAFTPPKVQAELPSAWGLTKRERQVVATLYASTAPYVTKDALVHAITDADDVDDDPVDPKIIDVFVCKIRAKLGLALAIETVWGEGYRLKPPARAAIDAVLKPEPAAMPAAAVEDGFAGPVQDLDRLSIEGLPRPPAHELGPKPSLRWLPVEALGIDRSYQRDVMRRGRANILRIAKAFDWSRFGPVIVAPAGDGRYAIIDGQHRSIAAKLVGISEVPCYVTVSDRSAQARAFAAINGAVTAITPMQLYHARVTAGDPKAARLARILEAAGARILKYPVPAEALKPGETLAAGALMRLVDAYDDDTLIRAIQCVTETGGGNPGLLRAPVVKAIARLLGANPLWRDAASDLFEAMDALDLGALWDRLSGRGAGTVEDRLTQALAKHLTKHLGPGAPVREAA